MIFAGRHDGDLLGPCKIYLSSRHGDELFVLRFVPAAYLRTNRCQEGWPVGSGAVDGAYGRVYLRGCTGFR
jgi:hypothetical protein